MTARGKIDSLKELIKDGSKFVASYEAGEIGGCLGALNESKIAIATAKKELAKLKLAAE